jgi:hypothetical protein
MEGEGEGGREGEGRRGGEKEREREREREVARRRCAGAHSGASGRERCDLVAQHEGTRRREREKNRGGEKERERKRDELRAAGAQAHTANLAERRRQLVLGTRRRRSRTTLEGERAIRARLRCVGS